MGTADGSGDRSESQVTDSSGPDTGDSDLLDRVRTLDVVHVVAAITAVALLARLVFLGARTMHWDEARVAYWILHTIETGDFAYRRIIHGPVVQHVNHVLVPLLGTSDFVMRLPVALVGGLFPMAALLFREHLDDDEVVVVGLFLAFNAVILYYSRFMRSDILVAAFMFTALGTLVRFYDTRRPAYLYAAAALIALGFGAKENALVYVLTWLGAAGLLADQALYRPRTHDSGLALLRAKLRGLRHRNPASGSLSRDSGSWLGHLLGAAVVFLALTVVIYGPRGAGLDGIRYPPPGADHAAIGLWEALSHPLSFPGYALDTLTNTGWEYWEWVTQSGEPNCNKDTVIDGWLCFLGQYVDVMRQHAPVITAASVAGFVYERYARPVSRNLVMFAAYGGFVSVLGYPLGTDVFGGWIVVHALVPLAIPAAVFVARIYRWGQAADADGDLVGHAAAIALLVVFAGTAGYLTVDSVYLDDTDRDSGLVQYAQPGDDLDDVIDAVRTARDAEGVEPDVLFYYGATGGDRDDNAALVREQPGWSEDDLLTRPPCAEWFNGLPLTYYFAAENASVECAGNVAELATASGADGAGVIVTIRDDPTVPVGDLETAGYAHETFELRRNDRAAGVYVHERLDVEWGL